MIVSKGPLLTVVWAELEIDNGANRAQQGRETLDDMLQKTDRIQILRALQLANGVIVGPNGAAARLRINRSTLVSRMQRLGIRASRNYIAPSQPELNYRAASAEYEASSRGRTQPVEA